MHLGCGSVFIRSYTSKMFWIQILTRFLRMLQFAHTKIALKKIKTQNQKKYNNFTYFINFNGSSNSHEYGSGSGSAILVRIKVETTQAQNGTKSYLGLVDLIPVHDFKLKRECVTNDSIQNNQENWQNFHRPEIVSCIIIACISWELTFWCPHPFPSDIKILRLLNSNSKELNKRPVPYGSGLRIF